MARVYMMCGRICSGKSTYAQRLRKEHKAVILSVDEITLALFRQDAGDMHDTYVERAEKYLYEKSVEIISTGINVILDWGFWTKRERNEAKEFYSSRGIDCGFCYIHITEEEWRRRIDKRNKEISEETLNAYYVDEGLAEKFAAIFEEPDIFEIEIRIDG